MKRGRKEVTRIQFEGVAADGGLVFLSNIGSNQTETVFKATAYANGIMEIAIDYKETIPRVAELVSGFFSWKSNFSGLDSVILNYRNIRLQVKNTAGRKDIICMLMQAMAMPGYKDSDNDVSVDTQTCQKHIPLRNSDKPNMRHRIHTNSFDFEDIFKWEKSLWYRNSCTRESIPIISLKDGIVTVGCIHSSTIYGFIAGLRKFFVPYSNFYGVKAVEVEFNEFSIRVDGQNIDRIWYLYRDIFRGLWEKGNTPQIQSQKME